MCAVGPAVSSLPKKRRWESNPLEAALQAAALPSGSSAKSTSVLARSRTGHRRAALVLRPSQGRVQIPHTPRTCFCSAPAEESNLVRQCRELPCDPAHPQGSLSKCLDQELNLDLDLRRVLCDPLHHRDIQHPQPGVEPGPGPSESPVRSATPSGQTNQSRRLELHQHAAVYRTAASLFGHIGNQQECEESNPVGRLWRPLPLPEDTPVRPPALRPGAWRNDYSANWTFQ